MSISCRPSLSMYPVSRWTLIGEEQPHADLHGLRLFARHQMELHNEIALRFEAPAHAVGREARRLSGRPTEKHAIRKLCLTAAAALVTCTWLIIVAPSRETRAIDFDVGVVHDPRISRAEFDSSDVRGRVQRNGNNECTKQIVALRGQDIRLGHLHDNVWRAELPRIGPAWKGGQVCRLASHHALRCPVLNRRDFLVRHAPLAFEPAMSRFRFPWRHRAGACHLDDAPRARAHILIGQQAEGGRLSGPMAGGAVPEAELARRHG